MMIARAEMSTNVQSSDPQGTAATAMSVAVIGPNDAHRRVVAQALASAEGRKIQEFIDYPTDLDDLARMMETKFDVVLVDVDTDESYALQIIAKLADFGPAVMAYSARTDHELLASCMRAGACDFLPLPSENATEAGGTSQPEAPVVQQVAPRPQAPRPAPPPPPAPAGPAARSNLKPIAPERRSESVTEVLPRPTFEERSAPSSAIDIEKSSVLPADPPKIEDPQRDFAEWDAANLRPAAPVPSVKKTEPRPRPSLVPDRRKPEVAARPVPTIDETPAPPLPPLPPIERPPVPVDIFRSITFHAESDVDEAVEKQGAKWIKWILIAAGPAVLALVLLIVFSRSSTSSPAPASAKTASAPPIATTNEPAAAPGSQLIVNATGKSASSATPALVKPSPSAQANVPAAQDSKPVSPDAMAQQLVAPTRIASAIKKTSPGDEPPPAAPAPVAFDDNSAIPGSVFNSGNKAKVAPHSVNISAGIAEGMIIRKTPPLYPRFAQEAHIGGKVVLKATITKQGNIEGVQVLSGPKILAPAAVDAVKTWKYRPYMLDNQPVAVETNITIVFGGQGI
jgi:protein TonB